MQVLVSKVQGFKEKLVDSSSVTRLRVHSVVGQGLREFRGNQRMGLEHNRLCRSSLRRSRGGLWVYIHASQ